MYLYIFAIIAFAVILILWIKRPVKLGFCSESDKYIEPLVVDNMLTPEEAKHILHLAGSKFENSPILSGKDDSIRKSETAWLSKNDPVIKEIYKRFSNHYNFTINNAEDLQVVKYEPGGFYNDHHDSCCDDNDHCRDFARKSGQRVLTILMYLNDDFEGGYTNFPNIGINLKADKYGGIVFYPLEMGGNRCHPKALHKGTPVTSGIKYVCNLWVREKKWV
jgi:prolyl 4-hydroxylase